MVKIEIEVRQVLLDELWLLFDKSENLAAVAIGTKTHKTVTFDAMGIAIICKHIACQLTQAMRKLVLSLLKQPLLHPFLNASRAQWVGDGLFTHHAVFHSSTST